MLCTALLQVGHLWLTPGLVCAHVQCFPKYAFSLPLLRAVLCTALLQVGHFWLTPGRVCAHAQYCFKHAFRSRYANFPTCGVLWLE
jgi:hypothetical protein